MVQKNVTSRWKSSQTWPLSVIFATCVRHSLTFCNSWAECHSSRERVEFQLWTFSRFPRGPDLGHCAIGSARVYSTCNDDRLHRNTITGAGVGAIKWWKLRAVKLPFIVPPCVLTTTRLSGGALESTRASRWWAYGELINVYCSRVSFIIRWLAGVAASCSSLCVDHLTNNRTRSAGNTETSLAIASGMEWYHFSKMGRNELALFICSWRKIASRKVRKCGTGFILDCSTALWSSITTQY